MKILNTEACRLAANHQADYAQQIKELQIGINQSWESLIKKAQEQRFKLYESYQLYSFLNDSRDLVSRMIIFADRLSNDAVDETELLEALIIKEEIDAITVRFKLTTEVGNQLLEKNHSSSVEIARKLRRLAEVKSVLCNHWEKRNLSIEAVKKSKIQIF